MFLTFSRSKASFDPTEWRGGQFLSRQQTQTDFLVARWREGDISARDRLIALVLPELEQIAAARLRRETNSSLSTHDLINEAVARLLRREGSDIANRAHFIALSSRLMRNILIDNARARQAKGRNFARVEIRSQIIGEGPIDLHFLNSALIRLEAIEPSYAEIVEMRYFGGMTISDIAEVTRCSEPTVKRRWKVAQAWLLDALSNPIDDD